MTENKLVIGCLEVCSLPELGIFDLEVRVDTGAQTSSLHVDNLTRVKRNGRLFACFDLHPDIYHLEKIIHCEALIADSRRIKSSNGGIEQRCVIQTQFMIGEHQWPIEVTLSNRADMTYMMLMGREAMAGRVLVDPGQRFLVTGNQ
ncbi:ATP-dependent zinc protease family protein [Vibrio stylophorae]|nr:RimK/LysX family protein [Vibrio stylophorae]